MEAKTEVHDEFNKIQTNPEYKKSLGLFTDKDVYKHLNISNMTYYKWKGQGGNGDFDIREAFLKDQKKIWEAFMKAVNQNKINAQVFRTFAQLANELVEKRGEKLAVVSTADRIRVATELRDGLRREFQDTGSCPICNFHKALRHEVCVDTEPEQSEDREVAALGLPTGLN